MRQSIAKTNSNSFENFLKRKKQENNGEEFDWETRRSNWLESVDKLYVMILRWLNPFVEESLLKIRKEEIEVCEEQLGTYNVKRLDIILGGDIISLLPRGTLVYGALGRVDFRGPKGELMFVESEWNKWQVALRTTEVQKWNLTKRSFQQAFKDVIDGFY